MPPALAGLGEWGSGGRRRGALVAGLMRAAIGLREYERALGRTLTALGPDIIHSNGFKAHIAAARIRRGDAALVWHMHEYVGARPVTRSLLRRYAGRCRAIVAVSESVAADVRQSTAHRVDVQVIHNAVDLARFAPDGAVADLDRLAGLTPAREGTVRVGLVATFSRWKGHETFLRALASLPPDRPVRGYVIGGAVYDTRGSQYAAEELKALASTLRLGDRVGFTGFVHETDEVMRALDVVVHASTDAEPFGLVIAEAMACGRAVVTSGTGGARELVRAGDDGLTHRPGDPIDLARVLSSLAHDAPLRQRLGAAARASAVRRFDARRLAGELTAAYDIALGSAVTAAR
jgi:glycosyltransferase involved in cell wall biosynthesis